MILIFNRFTSLWIMNSYPIHISHNQKISLGGGNIIAIIVIHIIIRD